MAGLTLGAVAAGHLTLVRWVSRFRLRAYRLRRRALWDADQLGAVQPNGPALSCLPEEFPAVVTGADKMSGVVTARMGSHHNTMHRRDYGETNGPKRLI